MSDVVPTEARLGPEITRRPEAPATREQVVRAFNRAYTELTNAPDTTLSPQEQWAKNAIKAAKEKTIDQDQNTFTNRFTNPETGQIYIQAEGIPVEELLWFLQKKIESLPTDSAERTELIEAGHVLYTNSQQFVDLPHRTEEPRHIERIRQEAYFISKDQRATGDMVMDWYKAINTLNRRRELVLPRETPGQDTPPPETRPGNTLPPAPIAEEGEENRTQTPPGGAPIRDEAETNQEDAQADANENPQPETVNAIRQEHIVTIARREEDIQKRAREVAEEQLREEMRRGSAFNPLNWPRKIGLRIMEEHYRQRFITRAERAMLQHNNAYLDIDVVHNVIRDANRTRAEELAAGKATVAQIKSGELIQGQQVVEAQGEFKTMILNDVIRPIIDGRITTEAQIQDLLRDFIRNNENNPQVQDQLRAIFGRDVSQYGRLAEYFASDLLETAELIKQDVAANRFTLDQLDQHVKIQLANTHWAADTQANFSTADRFIAWAESRRLTGLLVNPATVGAAFALGTFAFVKTTTSLSRAVGMTALPSLAAGPVGAPVLAGALAGGTFAALRRNRDLKIDMAAHRIERAYNMEIPPHGAPRREALEDFAYNTASVDDLIQGHGVELRSGTPRRSMHELLTSDLSNLNNRADLISRMTEIKTRLDFSACERVDLVTFRGRENVEQGRLALIQQIVEARRALRTAGIDEQDVAAMENNFTGEWNQRFTANRQQQDHQFALYRLRNAVGSGVFAGTVGVGGGLLGQEAFAQIGRHVPGVSEIPVLGALFGKKETAIEGALHKVGIHLPGEYQPPVEKVAGVGTGLNQGVLKQLYEKPGNLKLPNGMTLAVDGATHHASFLDAQGNTITAPPFDITKNGAVVVSGDGSTIPDSIKQLMDTWEQKPVAEPTYNLYNHIKDAVTAGQHEGFAHGNVEVDMNSGPDGQMSMRVLRELGNPDTGVHVHGFAHMDANGNPVIDLNHSYNGNTKFSDADWQFLHDEMNKNGWNITEETVPGSETVEIVKKPVLGPEGEWAKHTTEVKREWYAYNTPYSERNELMQYSMDKHGTSVTLDMSKMGISEQAGLSPSRIDVQEVIRNHQAVWAMSLPGQEAHPILISDGADGVWDGKLTLDPNDTDPTHVIQTPNGPMQLGEFAKILLNQDKLAKLPDGDIATEYYTNIKGENRLDVWQLNGGEQGRFGLISAGTVAEQNGQPVFKSFATIRGAGETPDTIGKPEPRTTPPYTIEHVIPPPAIEFIPPPAPPLPEVYDSPIIPIPFAPRHPLEPLRRPETPYYLERGFAPGTRLRDILRRGNGSTSSGSLPNYGYVPGTLDVNSPEATIALRETHEALTNTDSVYIVIDGAIGDAVISTAYFRAIEDALRKMGKNTPITLVVNDQQGTLYDSLASANVHILKTPRGTGVATIKSALASSSANNPLIIDFGSYTDANPEITQTTMGGKTITQLSNLLAPAIQLYNNDTDARRRYSHFVEELFSLSKDSLSPTKAQPFIRLPLDEDRIYQRVARENGIDITNTKQIGLVIEASQPGKRYSLKKWAQVLATINREHPGYQFNVIFNSATDPARGGYTRADIERELNATGVLGQSHIIDGNGKDLTDQAVLLNHQELVLSNDTGLAHIAGALEYGPNIVTAFMPGRFMPVNWISSAKQTAVTIPPGKTSALPPTIDPSHDQETDENRKLINLIEPDDIMQKVRTVL